MQNDSLRERDPATVLAGSTAILMLGMHRSGTSVSTRVVSLLGADLGTGFLPPAPDNPVGFWEHLGAHEIHERLLSALGREWHDISEMPTGWLDDPATHRAVDELVELCKQEFVGSSLWAVKDPRMCRLVPIWLAALERLGVRATAVFVTRAPDEVALSLKTRDGWEEGHSHLMWVQHLLEAERATRHIPRTMISYDRLMSDWRGAMERTAQELDLTWPISVSDAAAAIDAFIDPAGFRHHQGRAPESSSARSRFINGLYRASQEVQDGVVGWSIFDAFESGYQSAVDLFGWGIAAHEQKLRVLRQDMYIWQADSQQARDLLEVEAGNRARIETLDAALLAANERISALEAVIRASGARIAELEGALGASHDALLRSEAGIELLDSQKRALEEELGSLVSKSLSRRWLLKKFFRIEA